MDLLDTATQSSEGNTVFSRISGKAFKLCPAPLSTSDQVGKLIPPIKSGPEDTPEPNIHTKSEINLEPMSTPTVSDRRISDAATLASTPNTTSSIRTETARNQSPSELYDSVLDDDMPPPLSPIIDLSLWPNTFPTSPALPSLPPKEYRTERRLNNELFGLLSRLSNLTFGNPALFPTDWQNLVHSAQDILNFQVALKTSNGSWQKFHYDELEAVAQDLIMDFRASLDLRVDQVDLEFVTALRVRVADVMRKLLWALERLD